MNLCRHGHDLSDPTNQVVRHDPRHGSTYVACRTCKDEASARHRKFLADNPTYKPKRRKRRAFCRRGHAMTPENTYERPRRGPQCFICSRANKLKSDQRNRPTKGGVRSEIISKCIGTPATPAQVDIVRKAIERGKALYEAVAEVTTPHFYKNYAALNPAVHKQLRYLASLNTQRMPHIIAASRSVRTNSWLDAEALPAVERAISGMPVVLRDEVKSDLLLELWDGSLQPSDIANRARALLTKQYSAYDLSSKWGHRSLDAPIWSDGQTTLLETVSEGLWT